MHNWALKQLCAEKRTVNNCLQWEFYTVFKYNKLSNKIYLSTLIKKKNMQYKTLKGPKTYYSFWKFIYNTKIQDLVGPQFGF